MSELKHPGPTMEFRYIVFVLVHLILYSTVLCFNIEVTKVGQSNGEIGTQFGYSAAIVPQRDRGPV